MGLPRTQKGGNEKGSTTTQRHFLVKSFGKISTTKDFRAVYYKKRH